MRPFVIRHFSFVLPLLLASSAFAVRPQSFSFSAQKDFTDGTFDNTTVNSYGELSLSRELTPIPIPGNPELIAAITQTPDGTVYVATARDAKIYRIDPKTNKHTQIYKAPKNFSDITALASTKDGKLLIALAGAADADSAGKDDKPQKARLVELTLKDDAGGGKPTAATKFENDDVAYIWAIAQADNGDAYLATGPKGKVYKLPSGGGDASVILEAPAKNVLALAFDKSHNLIAGTDDKGLVIRVNTADAKQKPFVLLDAGKVDITGIILDQSKNSDGDIFVTTAKADLTGTGGGDEETPEEPDTKSKPSKPETEPMEPTEGAALPTVPSILATPPAQLSPDLKSLLNNLKDQAAQKNPPKEPPTTNKRPNPALPKKPKLPSHVPGLEPAPESTDNAALYKISSDGTVTTLFQEPDQNYALSQSADGQDLLIGTGPAPDDNSDSASAKILRYHLADQSFTLLARLKQEQVTSLFATSAGEILVGTANMAQLYSLSNNLAHTGTFTSQILAAGGGGIANWGHAALKLNAPDGIHATIATRSGNIRDTADKFWSDWSPELDASSASGAQIKSPPARYLQFRITLTAPTPTEHADASAAVTGIKLSYQTRNLPPVIRSVTVETAETESADDRTDRSEDADNAPRPTHIDWDASDPNNDTLSYRLYYRSVPATASSDEPWTLLVKDLKDATYEWNTASLPDGKYQIKVVASDKLDNPGDTAKEVARTSSPFTIDHTPPTLSDLKATVDGNKASITGTAADDLSTIADVRYQIDSQGDWQPATPSGTLFDSPKEAFTIVTRPLSAAGHRITIRATDAHGNSSFKAVTVTIK